MIRTIKIILVILVGLQGLIYFGSNIANWDAAKGAVEAIVTMPERPYYANALTPAITNGALITVALLIILAGELLVAILSFAGAIKLYGALKAPAEQFNSAKSLAIAGCAMAIIVWFGIFTVIGGALFQMWQSQLGQSSLGDAHKFIVPSGIILLFLAMRDD